jgi:aminomethyltransferase
MDEDHHPLESGLAWTVAFEPGDRDFIGRQALEGLRRAGGPELVGLLLEDRGVLRSHQKVIVAGAGKVADAGAAADSAGLTGEVTSGTFSPTLNRSIALARVPKTAATSVQVEIRGKLHAASIVKPPFARHGKVLIPL